MKNVGSGDSCLEEKTGYDAHAIEEKWQKIWADRDCDRASDDPEDTRPTYYCLVMFPYPSGNLHMGHVRNYCLGDAIARYKRMHGFNVLHPIGWDAFGLPAENAAIKHGRPPAEWTYANIAQMQTQLKRLGLSYDWSREIATCRPEYYHWEQWLFTRLLKKGLAYRKEAEVNWCTPCHTVLANEQVVDGGCWRCETPVTRRNLAQWFIRITDYAEELLADLDKLGSSDAGGWPEKVIGMQRNWIGRSAGAEVSFAIENSDQHLDIFTTRPDTLMGVTYMAVAAGHPLARHAAEGNAELAAFLEECARVSTKEADLAVMEKRGMSLGINAIHPISGERVPVYAANFVLMGYGTGAVMSVPAHDDRDFEFARRYNIPVRQVIRPVNGVWDIEKAAFTAAGVVIHSGEFDGLDSARASEQITAWLSAQGRGKARVQYRLRDWLVSRQRYWGAPIPVIHCKACGCVAVPDDQLPVRLPEQLQPTGGSSPLSECEDFIRVDCPCCGRQSRRETDTFDTFMESSWYMNRYTSPRSGQTMVESDAIARWLPVDQYIGGVEHAVLHLLYARFYHKLMRDAGLFTTAEGGDEPFRNLLTQGMVLKDGVKMSKSRGNTVNPSDIIDQFGADTARLFTLFAAPPEKDLEWSDTGIEGAHRFLNRVWRLLDRVCQMTLESNAEDENVSELRYTVHATIQRVTHCFERGFSFNAGIAALMELSNTLHAFRPCSEAGISALREGMQALIGMLVPFAPHFASECHARMEMPGLAVLSAWPRVDKSALVRAEVVLIVQINGKKRGQITVPVGCDREVALLAVRASSQLSRWLQEQKIVKVILVPNRLLNLVVRPG